MMGQGVTRQRHQTGQSGKCSGGQGSYREGPARAGEMHWQESHEIRRQVPSPVSMTE